MQNTCGERAITQRLPEQQELVARRKRRRHWGPKDYETNAFWERCALTRVANFGNSIGVFAQGKYYCTDIIRLHLLVEGACFRNVLLPLKSPIPREVDSRTLRRMSGELLMSKSPGRRRGWWDRDFSVWGLGLPFRDGCCRSQSLPEEQRASQSFVRGLCLSESIIRHPTQFANKSSTDRKK